MYLSKYENARSTLLFVSAKEARLIALFAAALWLIGSIIANHIDHAAVQHELALVGTYGALNALLGFIIALVCDDRDAAASHAMEFFATWSIMAIMLGVFFGSWHHILAVIGGTLLGMSMRFVWSD